MLKYTLGGLFAFVILAVTGLVILARVDDGDAGIGLAPGVTFVASVNNGTDPRTLEVERGQIWEFRLNNQRETRLVLAVQGEGVRQLPELQLERPVGSRDPLPYIQIEVGPGQSNSALVRFEKAGEFEGKVYIPGVFFTPEVIKITVK